MNDNDKEFESHITKCNKCGAIIPSNSNFCLVCGQRLDGRINDMNVFDSNSKQNDYDGMAIAGFVLSIISIFFNPYIITSILGLVFCNIGKKHTENGQTKGYGLAKAGEIISFIVGIIWMIIIAVGINLTIFF